MRLSFAPTHLYTRGPVEIVTSLRIAQHFDIPLVYYVEGCVSEGVALMRGRKGLHYYGLKYLKNKAIRKAQARRVSEILRRILSPC